MRLGELKILRQLQVFRFKEREFWLFRSQVLLCFGRYLQVAKLGQAESVTGANLMFLSITAAVVGGVALWGAIGGVFNALIGVLIVAVINNGMVVIGLPDYLQDGVLGLLVIAAVILSTNRSSIRFVK